MQSAHSVGTLHHALPSISTNRGGCQEISCNFNDLNGGIPSPLDVEFFDVEGVGFDELAARLDLIAHEEREELIRLERVVDAHLQ